MRRRDRLYAAKRAHFVHGLIIDIANAIPEKVAVRGLDEKGALTDRKVRFRSNADQTSLLFPKLIRVVQCLHLCERRPFLPLPAHVLAFVLADEALRRRRVRDVILHAARLADERFHA
jgi:hypothetical protein